MKKQKIILTVEKEEKLSKPFDDVFFDEMLKSVQKDNEFEYAIKQAMIKFDKQEVSSLYNSFTNYLANDPDSEGKLPSEKDVRISLIKRICNAVLEFVVSKNFEEKNSLQYAETFGDNFNPKIFSFLLWTQDKREGAFSILKKYPANFTEEQYNHFYETVRAKSFNRDLPLNGQLENDYLEQQKNEFLFHQSRYHVKAELDKLPINEAKPKRIKL
jgi:hypothetical protein